MYQQGSGGSIMKEKQTKIPTIEAMEQEIESENEKDLHELVIANPGPGPAFDGELFQLQGRAEMLESQRNNLHAIATEQANAIMRMQDKLDRIEDVVEYTSCDWEETCRLVSAILSEEGKADDQDTGD
jgi:hypothetical protein